MTHSYAFLFVFLFFLSLSATNAHAQAINTEGTIQHNGLTREYRLYVPAIYNPAQATPLLLNLHGYSSTNGQQQVYGNFTTIADTANIILIHPNGTIGSDGYRFWNAGFSASGPDDVGFLLALIDTISAQYNIDPARIYTTGMSNGGFMSYELACQTNRFAAMASVTGTMVTQAFNNCSPTHPIPVMEIHGTADSTVLYNGSPGSLSTEQVVNYWVQHNNCNLTPTITDVPNTNASDGATAQHYVYAGGDGGTSVEHFKVIGGGHTWPGAISIPLYGNTCKDFNASVKIWRFFRQYNLDAITHTPTLAQTTAHLSVSPNPVANELHISLNNKQLQNVYIYDALGKLMYSQSCQSNQQTLSVDNLQAGFYVVKATDGKNWYNNSFIKW